MHTRSFLIPALYTAAVVAQSNSTCYSGVKVLMARGTNETQGQSILETVVKPMLAAIPNSSADEIVYPASYDFIDSAEAGYQNTQQQLFDYHNACPQSKIVLMGYSQGAAVIGAVISGGGGFEFGIQVPQAPSLCGQIAQNVIAVVQIGDPGRNLGVGQDADVGGPACNVSSGTPRTDSALAFTELYASRLQEWCAAGDPVCCATGKNFAAHGSYFLNSTNYDVMASFVASRYSSAAFPVTAAYSVTDCTPLTAVPSQTSSSSLVTSATTTVIGSLRPTGTGVRSGTARPTGSSAPSSSPSVSTPTAPTSSPTTPSKSDGQRYIVESWTLGAIGTICIWLAL